MICPGCNKFAGYDEPNMEVNDADIDGGGNLRVEGRMSLSSSCCGEELKEWNFEIEQQVEHDTSKGEHELSVECNDAEGSDYYDGKPNTPSRYRRHIYTVTATAEVSCSCGFKESVELKDENRASGFDELV